MNCEYILVNPIFIEINNKIYKDNNILNKKNYDFFELFIKDIINIIYGIKLDNNENEENNLPEFSNISSITLNSKNNFTTTTIINTYLIIFRQYKILDFINIVEDNKGSAEYIKELSDGSLVSGGNKKVVFYHNFKKAEEINEDNLGVFDAIELGQVVVFSKNNLYMRPYNTTNTATIIKSDENIINMIYLKGKYVFECSEKGIYFIADFMNNIVQSQKQIVYEKKYIGAINVNDKLAIFNSNSILVNGEDKLISYNIINKRIKDLCNGYSFTLSRNNMSLMNIPKEHDNLETYKLLFVACKKYIKNQKNGILFLILEIKNNNIINFYKDFYDTGNYEVYCFCPIFKVPKKYILDDKNKETTRKETEYFLVGGFDLNKREGLIKLYRVMCGRNYKNIKIEFILDVDFGKYSNLMNSFNESSLDTQKIKGKRIETFKGFRGPRNCITQTKKEGYRLINCYDGNIYLTIEPLIENIKIK